MRIQCPNCHKQLRVAAEMAGKRGRCAGCGNVFAIPSAPSGVAERRSEQATSRSLPQISCLPSVTRPIDRATVISLIEEMAQRYSSDMSSAKSLSDAGCLLTILFFPIAIPLFVVSGRRKRNAEATAKEAIGRILSVSGLNSTQVFALALEAPTAKAVHADTILPLIDREAFEQHKQMELDRQQKELHAMEVTEREPELKALLAMELEELEFQKPCPKCGGQMKRKTVDVNPLMLLLPGTSPLMKAVKCDRCGYKPDVWNGQPNTPSN